MAARDNFEHVKDWMLTEVQLIFVGEHTSYTHAWIASALDSGIRGAVQLLLGKHLLLWHLCCDWDWR